MTFQGWPEEAIEFYEGLEADNSKAYWLAHKHIYEECVVGPMAELLDELTSDHGNPRIFRPYRDVRFSRDKSPYKTEIGASLDNGYVRFSAQGLGVGSGMYMMSADQLDRYRQAVDADPSGQALEQVVAHIRDRGIQVNGHGALKTAPRGYRPDHPRIELLRFKGLVAWREWPVQPWLATAAAKQYVVEVLAAAQPLNTWLGEHVGPPAVS